MRAGGHSECIIKEGSCDTKTDQLINDVFAFPEVKINKPVLKTTHCSFYIISIHTRNTLDCDQSNGYSSRVVFSAIS